MPSSEQRHLGPRVAVIGGGMAGLLAARVLADHFDAVTVLERDRFPDAPEGRKGVPQARHIHVLLAAGREALTRLLPGLMDDLRASGVEDYDATQDMEWFTPAGLCQRFPSGIRLLGATRDLIDWCVRRQVLAHDRIVCRQNIDVTGLRFDPTGTRVVGLTLDDRTAGTEEVLDADLVIDAAGRGSRTPGWLEAAGYPKPEETVVNAFLGYASRLVRRPESHPVDWKVFYIQCAPPGRRRGGVISSVEGGRWIVTLAGGGKDYPPTDEEAFREFARSLPDPRFAEAYEAAEPLTPITPTRSTENRFRHYECPNRRPEGLLVTGDAACAFNPVYGQGMTTASIGAETLADCLRRCRGGRFDGLAARFQMRLARANARPWLLATAEDYRYREAEGPRPGLTTRLAHRYLDRVVALSTRHPGIHRRFVEVVHLLRPPSSLFSPGVMARVLVT